MPSLFFIERRWVTTAVLIGIIVVASLVIISVYSPPENKMSETAKICADSAKTEACKEALLSSEIWGVKKWTKTFGSPSSYDAASSVRQTSDGGFIIIGTTGRNASNFTRFASTYFIKTDNDGNTVWEKIFGADEGIGGKSAQQTSDGGYIIAGGIAIPLKKVDDYSAKYKSNIYLSKTDADGNIIWEKNHGAGDADERVWGQLVRQTTDGGYIILGVVLVGADPHIHLLKVNTNGNMQWNKTFGEYYSEIGYSVQQTFDGGYIVTADTRRGIKGNEGDIHLIKTDGNGNLVWDKLIDPLGKHENDYPYDAKQTSDGGYIILEYTEDESGTGAGNTYLLKIDPDGNMDWRKILLELFAGYTLDIASDDGYIVTGRISTRAVDNNYLIKMKTNADGNVLWTKAIDENVSGTYNSIQQTSDGGYLVYTNQESGVFGSGLVNTDIVLVKIDETSTPRPPIEGKPVIIKK
ncbi:MAG: hypothetical protein WA139_02100 [Candidatus Aenigmatarchaeota archaeon]